MKQTYKVLLKKVTTTTESIGFQVRAEDEQQAKEVLSSFLDVFGSAPMFSATGVAAGVQRFEPEKRTEIVAEFLEPVEPKLVPFLQQTLKKETT